MGKAEIISGGTAGLYVVRILLDRTLALARIAKLDGEIGLLDQKISALEAEIATLQSEYEAAKTSLPPTTFSELAAMAAAINAKKASHGLCLVERTSKAATQRLLQAIPDGPVASAWCADLTENLTGIVGTIEPNGEPSGYIVRPGYSDGAVYDAFRDGQIQPIMSSTPEGAFCNKALMPGWQKWMPTYRIGTIAAIDTLADTCSVTLEAAASVEQSLNINQVLMLTAVPVAYMDCNTAAFSVGDEVIVEFQDQNQAAPRVIGFKDHPKGSWRESWGNEVCSNHSWTYGYCLWDCVYITCPENDRIFTNERGESRLSLHGGSLTLATKYYGGGANLHSVIYLTNESDRPVLSKRQMRIKCFTQTPMYGGVNLYIKDSAGNAGYLAFGGWVNIGTINGVSNDIAAGIGIEKMVDLSVFGFAVGRLAEFRIETWVTKYTTPNEYCSVDIDYIIIA